MATKRKTATKKKKAAKRCKDTKIVYRAARVLTRKQAEARFCTNGAEEFNRAFPEGKAAITIENVIKFRQANPRRESLFWLLNGEKQYKLYEQRMEALARTHQYGEPARQAYEDGIIVDILNGR